MTCNETTIPHTDPETVSQSCGDDPLAIPAFLRRTPGDRNDGAGDGDKIELHYAYPSSPNGGRDGCYYTAGQDERRHDYATIPDALADIATRHPGAVIEFQFGGPERVDEFRQFDGPAAVTSSLDYTRGPLARFAASHGFHVEPMDGGIVVYIPWIARDGSEGAIGHPIRTMAALRDVLGY
jgi:hypothetical protein